MKSLSRTTKHIDLAERLLGDFGRRLTPAAAQVIADFEPTDATIARVRTLADKCNEGDLTSAERSEYQSYVETADLIAILQLKARRVLNRRKSG